MRYSKIEMEILEYLYDQKINPGSRFERFYLKPLVDRGYKYQSLLNKFSSLKEQKLVGKTDGGEYYITWKGIEYFESGRYKQKLIDLNFGEIKNKTKNLLVIYDIPESSKKEREWFRKHLKKLDFEMIQRSVWIGPSPLPKSFLEYVEEIGIKKDFKTFKLSKSYNTSPK